MEPAEKQLWTLLLMILTGLFVIVSDIVLCKLLGPQATYSRVAAHLFARHPLVLAITLFSLGCLVGHAILPTYPR